MPQKPETLLSEKVLSRLRAEGGHWDKIHGGPYQLGGISDVLGCWKGRYIAIELKMPGKVPTRLQGLFLNDVYDSGGRAGVAYSIEDALTIRDGKNFFIKF